MADPTPFPMPSWPEPTSAPADAGREPLTAATVPPTAGAEALEAPPTTTAVVGAPTGYSSPTLPHTGAADLALLIALALALVVVGLALVQPARRASSDSTQAVP